MGWVKDLVSNYTNLVGFTPVAKITPSKVRPQKKKATSADGYYFEHEELKRLMRRLKRFETVEFTDVEGTPLTPDIIEKRFSPDGGIDCIIHIIAPTERGANIVATRIRNILVNGDY